MRRAFEWRRSWSVWSWALAAGALGLLLTSVEVRAQEGNFNYQNGFDDGLGLGVYAGTVDTNIQLDAPDTNSNNEPYLWVDGPAPTQQLLIRFDGIVGHGPGQVAAGNVIAAAELVLVVSDVADAGSGHPHRLHRLLQPWDAATITWNNDFGGDGIDADEMEASTAYLDTTPNASANATIRLDVKSAVESWIAGASNHGLVLRPNGTDGLAIRSSDDPSVANRPRLEISACGEDAFADQVESFDPVSSGGGPAGIALHPEEALGVPDWVSGVGGCTEGGPSNCKYVSLGSGGAITLRFIDNMLTGSGGPEKDLWIYEIGPDVEDTFVEISSDGLVWEDVGKVFGSTSAIDIDAFGFGPESGFAFVRLTDDPDEGDIHGWTVGADIDAICALSSVSVTVPSLRPLGIASLMLLIILVTTVGVLRREAQPANGGASPRFP